MFGLTINVIFAAVITVIAALILKRHIQRRDQPVAIAFLIAIALIAFFGFRVIDRALYWTDPAHRQQAPEAWMTIGYLSKSWHIPPPELARALGVRPDERHGRNLAEIAADHDMSTDQIIGLLAETLPRLSAKRPAPDPGPDGAGR
ncbi:MAG: hypothetical protein ACK5LJ_15310 [Paracoccus sp. (in: a-proteobacteria)]